MGRKKKHKMVVHMMLSSQQIKVSYDLLNGFEWLFCYFSGKQKVKLHKYAKLIAILKVKYFF